mgnify:FL=1
MVGHTRHLHGTFYDLLAHTLRAPLSRLRQLGGETASDERFWALSDVNFDIQPGEVVGVIGRNGAGKSTLLKILSRITAPTKGRVTVRGRLASLLEVGTGFHPELSGRENIYLNGAILGMGRAEVARKFDEIVAFAEVEKFIDTPVKRYSSGMYVRLAFAVAAHLDSDVLIIDEVLAVGDADFQQKCIGRMEKISKTGKSILVVSHNVHTIQKLCQKAIFLESGKIISQGQTEDVQTIYRNTKNGKASWMPFVRDTEPFQYESVSIALPRGLTAEAIPADQNIEIEFKFQLSESMSGRIACKIRNQNDFTVLTSSDTDAEAFINRRWQSGRYIERCTIPSDLLAPGSYWITISRPIRTGNEIIIDALMFRIDKRGSLVDRDNREGVVAPLLCWKTEIVQ